MKKEARARHFGGRSRSTGPHGVRKPVIELLEHRNLLTTLSFVAQQDTSLFENNAGVLANGAGEFFFVGATAPRNNKGAEDERSRPVGRLLCCGCTCLKCPFGKFG